MRAAIVAVLLAIVVGTVGVWAPTSASMQEPEPASPTPRAASGPTNYCDTTGIALSRTLAFQSEDVIWRATGLLPNNPVSARVIDPLAPSSSRVTIVGYGVPTFMCEDVGTFSAADLPPGTYVFLITGTSSRGGTVELTAPLTIVASARPPTATPRPLPLPAAPGGLQARAVGPNAVRLDWADNSNNEDGFRIDGAGQFRTRANVTTLTVGVEPSSFNCFFLYAFNDAGESYGGVQCASTPARP